MRIPISTSIYLYVRGYLFNNFGPGEHFFVNNSGMYSGLFCTVFVDCISLMADPGQFNTSRKPPPLE